MLYLVGEVTVLTEGPLFQGGVYVSKGGWVPINLHFYMYNVRWCKIFIFPCWCKKHVLLKVV